MPGWLILMMQMFNLIGSSGMVGIATYGQMAGAPGSKTAAIVATAGAALQQLRDNPLSAQTLADKAKVSEVKP